MRNSMIAAALTLAPLSAVVADEVSERKQQSVAVVQEFMGELKGHLEKAMKSGGPVSAIGVCNQIAPTVAQEQSDKHGWKVGRTSLRLRNPGNAPDVWERKVLEQFDARRAAGEDPATMAHAEVVEQDGGRTFRFMKAIPTGEVCLKCHGQEIPAPVGAKLNELYPEDRATGYNLGEIRGAFTITQPM